MNIYTDGSCFQRPRRGGIGIRYIIINDAGDEEWQDECPPGYKQATNNEMELLACIVALRDIPDRMVMGLPTGNAVTSVGGLVEEVCRCAP